MEIINWIIDNWTVIAEGIATLVALASIITGMTPSPKDDEILKKIIRLFSVVTHKDESGTFKAPLAK